WQGRGLVSMLIAIAFGRVGRHCDVRLAIVTLGSIFFARPWNRRGADAHRLVTPATAPDHRMVISDLPHTEIRIVSGTKSTAMSPALTSADQRETMMTCRPFADQCLPSFAYSWSMIFF